MRIIVHGENEIRIRLEGIARVPHDREVLRGIGLLGVRDIQRSIRLQRRPDGRPYPKVDRYGRSGQRLRDTGALVGSLTFQISGRSTVRIGTNRKQAPLQHFGGVVKSKRPGGMLAIPATRQIARAVAGQGFRTAFPDAFVIKSIDGSVILVRRATKGRNGRLQLLASLRRSVTIPGTGFNDISDRGRNEMVDLIAKIIRRRVEGGR